MSYTKQTTNTRNEIRELKKSLIMVKNGKIGIEDDNRFAKT